MFQNDCVQSLLGSQLQFLLAVHLYQKFIFSGHKVAKKTELVPRTNSLFSCLFWKKKKKACHKSQNREIQSHPWRRESQQETSKRCKLCSLKKKISTTMLDPPIWILQLTRSPSYTARDAAKVVRKCTAIFNKSSPVQNSSVSNQNRKCK